jgi:hypothetical protein
VHRHQQIAGLERNGFQGKDDWPATIEDLEEA